MPSSAMPARTRSMRDAAAGYGAVAGTASGSAGRPSMLAAFFSAR